MATGSDKNVWFTEQAARIGTITSTGVTTEYAIPSGVNGNDIAPGASGTLWFNEGGNSNTIGKISTAGHVTEYPLPSGEYAIGGIGKGPDGNMWFTDQNSNSIGKITPTGAVTEYSLPYSQADPNDIVAGPDGNLWFTELGFDTSGQGHVGKITTAGVVTEFTNPTGSDTAYIAAGPDGNLYACSGADMLQVTTAGVITPFGGAISGCSDIILGPDKQLWLIVTNGNMQEFNPKTLTFSAHFQPDAGSSFDLRGFTVGGDGDVWVSGYDDNSILVLEEKITTIGIRLNGELSFTDPNYGFELGYAVGTTSTQTQTISLSMGESVKFKNVDTVPHSAAFLGNATSNSAPWPGSFNGSTVKSLAGTAIGTMGWATGSLNPNKTSPIYETGLPGFYMIGCQYHYNTNEMRTVIVVH